MVSVDLRAGFPGVLTQGSDGIQSDRCICVRLKNLQPNGEDDSELIL